MDEMMFSKAYEVHGTDCRNARFSTGRLHHVHQDPNLAGALLKLPYGDLYEGSNLASMIGLTQPDEVYSIAARVTFASASICRPAPVIPT
jgi:GDPmannose 4,6-dehydratase